MTLILAKRQDKERSLDLLTQVLHQFIFAGLAPPQEANVREHLEWMRRQTATLYITCKLETFPETQTTRIVIDASFAPRLAQN